MKMKMLPVMAAVLIAAVSCMPVPHSIDADVPLEKADHAYERIKDMSAVTATVQSAESRGAFSNGTKVVEKYEGGVEGALRTISNSEHTLVEEISGNGYRPISIDGKKAKTSDYNQIRRRMFSNTYLWELDIVCSLEKDGKLLDMAYRAKKFFGGSLGDEQKISMLFTDGTFSAGFVIRHDSSDVTGMDVGGCTMMKLQERGLHEARRLWTRAYDILMDFWRTV